MNRRLQVPSGLWALLAVGAMSGPAYGQQNASIVGTVRDPSGGVMPGTKVTATSAETGLARVMLTNAEGNYVLASLGVGTYTVSAELPGFKTQVVEKVKLDVNQTVRVDFVLEVGELAERVVVAGIPRLLQTDDAQLGTLIENAKVLNLPLNGRNFTQLSMLVAGAVESPGNAAGTHLASRGAGLGFSVHGQRSNYNGFMLDGAVVKEYQHESPAFSPSIDALQEFRVETSNYSAEFGAEAGAHVNMVIKSGTNEFHGTAHEFHRNDALSARNFFASEKPDFERNQFGGTLGGPVVKNKLFFFGSYEGARIGSGLTLNGRVPEAKARAGDFSDLLARDVQIIDPLSGQPFPGNAIPPDRIDPIARRILSEFVPLP